MTKPTARRALLLGVILCAPLLLSTPAQAQNDNEPVARSQIRPPQPRRAEGVPLASYGAVIVVLVLPLLVNFISSKRGHQD